MKNANNSISNNIMEMLTTRKQERAAKIAEYNAEQKEACSKLEVLTQEHENAETPEQFKKTAQQIHEQEEYIEFLSKRKQATNEPVITYEEYKDIAAKLNAENDKALSKAAPEILKKFNELISLLEAYSATADELQEVLNCAQNAHFNRKLGGHMRNKLTEQSAGGVGYTEEMLRAFFNRYGLVESVKRLKKCPIMDATAARVYHALND